MKDLLKNKVFITNSIAVAILLLVSIIYFRPLLKGKVMQQYDMVQVGGMVKGLQIKATFGARESQGLIQQIVTGAAEGSARLWKGLFNIETWSGIAERAALGL